MTKRYATVPTGCTNLKFGVRENYGMNIRFEANISSSRSMRRKAEKRRPRRGRQRRLPHYRQSHRFSLPVPRVSSSELQDAWIARFPATLALRVKLYFTLVIPRNS